MTAPIEVTPAPDLRTEFAQYATGYTVRTTSRGFAVGPDLFAAIPERLLAGATVDGQPWQTPDPQPETPSSGKRGSPRTKEN